MIFSSKIEVSQDLETISPYEHTPEGNGELQHDVLTKYGIPLRLDWCCPSNEKHVPAIIVLHGADGRTGTLKLIKHLLPRLTSKGYCAILVHYLKTTGTPLAGEDAIRKYYEKWAQAIQAAIRIVKQDERVDETRIALLGYSLGGFLAITVASREIGIQAVAEIAGGIDPINAGKMHHLPPLFILHGSQDEEVSVDHAFALKRVAGELSSPCEMHIYPTEGHILSLHSLSDALDRVLAFFSRHLSG